MESTYETWSRFIRRGQESTHDSWGRLMSRGVDLWSRGVDPLVMESNYESYSRLMELRSQLTTDRGVEESWSQSISRVVELSVVESICN